jgi:acyl-CoA synthetase (NDP forming)
MIAIAIGLDIPEFARAVIAAGDAKPTVGCLVAPNSEKLLAESGIANYPSVDRAVRVLRNLIAYGRIIRSPSPPQPGRFVAGGNIRAGTLSEAESKAFLAAYGLPITNEAVVNDGAEAKAAALRLGFPIALKVSSDAVLHKTEAGGVLLGLENIEAVERGAELLRARFSHAQFLVQQMVPPGLELIVGGHRTKATGAVVMIGIGGVFAEVLDDVVFCRAPASEAAVDAAIRRLRSQRLLKGFRGAAAIDTSAVRDIVVRLSNILATHPTIAELDLNPVICGPGGAIIVDALIRTDERLGEAN